jgi:putative PIN family toxin of toxin-antitoxin system
VIPLRLVVDTNLVVSAVLRPDGTPRTVLIIALTRPAMLFASEPILAEYRRVLARPELGIRRGLRIQLMQLIRNRARIVRPGPFPRVAADADDDKFLACAQEARADYLITGNLRHFPDCWRATKMISPAAFLAMAAPHVTS